MLAELSLPAGLEGWTPVATLTRSLASPGGLDGWNTVFAVPAQEVAAPSTPQALLDEIKAEALLAQVHLVHRAFLDSRLGPRPVVVAPPAWIQYEVQLAEALAAEASLPQLGQQGFEERYRSAIVEYNKLFNHEVPGIDWWDHSDGESDLE